MKQERFVEIDLLRGTAMIGVIVNHVAAYFFSHPGIPLLWEITQFSAPVFIFCSVFLFFHRNFLRPEYNGINYVLKRIERLLFPYYVFLLIILPIIFYFEPQKVTAWYVAQNIFLLGGIDINWLVMLVIQFSILLPLLAVLLKRNRSYMIGFGVVSLLSSTLLLLYHWPYSYLLIMWLPWGFFAFLSWLFLVYRNSTEFLYTTIGISGIVYAVATAFLLQADQTLSFYQHKYPPDLYMISFGVFSTVLLFVVFQKLRLPNWIAQPIHFYSYHSYTLYFIHFTLIYVLSRILFDMYHYNFWFTVVGILLLATSVQYGLNVVLSLVDRKK